MSVTLVMFKADGTRRDFPLSDGATVIGRKNSCDLRIPLTSVSRQHCEVVLDGDAVTLRDLGSSNGTFHNAKRVQQVELSAGDEVTVGPVVFTLVIDGQPDQINPSRTILSNDSGGGTAEMPAVPEKLDASGPGPAGADETEGNRPATELDEDAALAELSKVGGDPEGSSMFEIDFGDDSEAGLDMEVLNEDDL